MQSVNQKKNLVFLVTELGYFCSHRLSLAMAAKNAGFHVSVIANCGRRKDLARYEKTFKELTLYHLPFDRSSLNPLKELTTIGKIWSLYRKIRPHIVHQVAFKPAIYGTLCARLLKIPLIINAFGGMGYLFTRASLKALVIKPFLLTAIRVLMNHARCVLILQNSDDVKLMTPLTGADKIHLMKGAGVNLALFTPGETPASDPCIGVMVSRLLWTKGVGELVQAARILKNQQVPLKIQVAGEPDPHNPDSIPERILEMWKKEGIISWLGARSDIAAVYTQAHIAILPSYYREGIPKSLLEAAACGKPIVTTDAVGCRDVVEEGINGFLVPPRDSIALAGALKKLADSSALRNEMGQSSRRKAEQEFDENQIIAQTLFLYQKGLL